MNIKLITILIGIITYQSILAQNDLKKNNIQFEIDVNDLLKREGLTAEYLTYERLVANKYSFGVGINYISSSSKITIDDRDDIVNSQGLSIKLKAKKIFGSTDSFKGFYCSLNPEFSHSLLSENNEQSVKLGLTLELGYQYIIKSFLVGISIGKGYYFTSFQSDEISIKNSSVGFFESKFSIGYVF